MRGRLRLGDVARLLPAAVLSAAALLAGCGDEKTSLPVVSSSDATIAVIRWELATWPPEPDEDGSVELPVIYVASAVGDAIDAGTQASVVDATKDEAVVRFADSRADAVDSDDPAEPVKDDGVLLLLGAVPSDVRTVELEVGRYGSLVDQATYVLTITATASGARVSNVSEVPAPS